MTRQLVEPIDYRIDLMDVCADPKITEEPGKLVHVLDIKDELGLRAVPPEDTYNYNRLMALPGTKLVGLGFIVERVSITFFVAWRPFSPAPKLVIPKD